MSICPNCGLPKEICACQTIAKEEAKIRIFSEKRRFGKAITVIVGLGKEVDKKQILKEMKTRLACGGTLKNDEIELQGSHTDKAFNILIKLGFNKDQIEVR